MSSPTSPQATPVTPQADMAALVSALETLVHASASAQAHLNKILLGASFVPVPSFVAGTPPTPAELAATIAEDADEFTPFWVVIRGRQPGLCRSPAAAEKQTTGVPRGQANRKVGRAEALAFYAANYPAHVNKWDEVPAPVPVALPIADAARLDDTTA